jgi:hypothetical protein
MNFDGMTKEEVYSLREEMERKLIEANKNKGDVEQFIFDTFDVPERESMVGTCFSYRNSYGCGSDIPPWFEYARINSYNKAKDSFNLTTIYQRVGEACIKNHDEYAFIYDKDNYTTRKPIPVEEFETEFAEVKSMLI